MSDWLARSREHVGWLRSIGWEGQLERVREAIEVRECRRLLEAARAGRETCWLEPEDDDEPLVSIRIATKDRVRLLDRAIESALAQTYERVEIVVIGDGCDDRTADAIGRRGRPSIRYVNLGRPSWYPANLDRRWRVIGSVPMTVGNLVARGAWIAPCDDDDVLTASHVEVLLAHAKRARLEFVHSKSEIELGDGSWSVVGDAELRPGAFCHGSVLFSAGLRFIPYSTTCWKLGEPQDWNMWRRMRQCGVRMGFLDEITYRHFGASATSSADGAGDGLR